jgi:hypothetical protein
MPYPRHFHVRIKLQSKTQLGGMMLDVPDVIDVKLGARALPPISTSWEE